MIEHVPHPHIAHRRHQRPALHRHERLGFNGRLALGITNIVGTMWCAYAFALLALVSLPDSIKAGTTAIVAWVAQTFIQLVLLSIIMVGQKVNEQASEKQALQTFKDTEAILDLTDEVHRLIKEVHAHTSDLTANSVASHQGDRHEADNEP
jgi:hypothetical protein